MNSNVKTQLRKERARRVTDRLRHREQRLKKRRRSLTQFKGLTCLTNHQLPGKYESAKCNATSDRVCETCPPHTYIEQENFMSKCLSCRECSSNENLMTDKECEADRNRQCKCKPGYYCKHKSEKPCDFCDHVSSCPPGKGVTRQYTDMRDTECSPCLEGTYSDVEDYFSSCKNHTSCEALGRHLKGPGTDTTDAVCGDFKASCPWMLPAGLWAGLVVTFLIIFLALFFIYRSKKRTSHRSVNISEYLHSPVLPPDILKYPGVEKHAEYHQHTHTVENDTNIDCNTGCGCGAMPVRTVSEKYSESNAANGYKDSIMCHSTYQSEPQESEWND